MGTVHAFDFHHSAFSLGITNHYHHTHSPDPAMCRPHLSTHIHTRMYHRNVLTWGPVSACSGHAQSHSPRARYSFGIRIFVLGANAEDLRVEAASRCTRGGGRTASRCIRGGGRSGSGSGGRCTGRRCCPCSGRAPGGSRRQNRNGSHRQTRRRRRRRWLVIERLPKAILPLKSGATRRWWHQHHARFDRHLGGLRRARHRAKRDFQGPACPRHRPGGRRCRCLFM